MEINGETLFTRECPHCGEMLYLSVREEMDDEYYVRCDKCLSRGPVSGSPRAAVNNWNTRAKKTPSLLKVGVEEVADAPF